MGLAHSPSIVRDGLVLYLDAANSKSYPGSSAIVTDLISKDQGQIDQGVIFQNNLFFQCNNGEGISFPHSAILKLSINDWTYGGWIMFTSSTSGSNNFFQKDDYEYGIWWNGSSVRPHFNPSGTIYYSTFSYQFNLNEWYYVISTWRNSDNRIEVYVNGKKEYSNNATNTAGGRTLNDEPITLGRDPSGDENISNYSVYNRALSESEITQNFEALRGRYGI